MDALEEVEEEAVVAAVVDGANHGAPQVAPVDLVLGVQVDLVINHHRRVLGVRVAPATNRRHLGTVDLLGAQAGLATNRRRLGTLDRHGAQAGLT